MEEGRLREVKASRNDPGLNYLFFADDLLVFSEVNEDQLRCIKVGLQLFCSCSGQRINFHKSFMFFPSNVPEEEAMRLSGIMGIPVKKTIGKYLGHYIVLKGRERIRHNEILKRINNKIDGWKLKCLSKAGRLTLAQSVLGSILVFYMQLEWLPGWVHKELDKAVRKCI